MENIEDALKLAQKNNEKIMEGLSWVWLGRVQSRVVPLDNEAKKFIVKGIKILDELKLRPAYSQGYLFLGELCVDTGKKKEAIENLKKAEKMFRRMEMNYWLNKTQKVLKNL